MTDAEPRGECALPVAIRLLIVFIGGQIGCVIGTLIAMLFWR